MGGGQGCEIGVSEGKGPMGSLDEVRKRRPFGVGGGADGDM